LPTITNLKTTFLRNHNDLDVLSMWPEEPLHNVRLRPQLLPQLRLLSKAPRSETIKVLPPEAVRNPRWLIFLDTHPFLINDDMASFNTFSAFFIR
jgi:hypothetical protein